MLKNIRKLNTRLCLTYILACTIFLGSQAVMFESNTIKASAQECSKNKVEVETIEVVQLNTYAAPEIITVATAIRTATDLVPAELNISEEVVEEVDPNLVTVNPVDIAENVEDIVIKHTSYIAENYVPESPLTDKELDLLARVIHAESGNQDEKGKRLVADTVLNRMAYNNADIHSIVYADGQFSTAPILYNADNTPTEEELQIAFEESISQIDYEVYYFRTGHYHACGHPAFQWGAHYFSNV